MANLTLYRANRSCSLVSHALLRHLSIPFTTILMKFGPEGIEAADGSLSHTDYLAIHPLGYVPALVIDGTTTITETPAILTYIASLAPSEHHEPTDRRRQHLAGTGDRVDSLVVGQAAWNGLRDALAAGSIQ